MKTEISIIKGKNTKAYLPNFLSIENTEEARAFHRSLKGYEKTPLVNLKCLAKDLGVKAIYVKDESKRFGLNAFKALGASYAVHKICETDKNACDKVFVTTTDGNHGKGLAWSAHNIGAKAEVFMPKGSMEVRAEAIRAIGDTKVTITDMNYDDAVRYSSNYAKQNGYYFVQDTGAVGYEETPNRITQGYSTMAFEAIKQLEEDGVKKPTHVFLQAGVGSMAGGVLGVIAHYYKQETPITTIVEPDAVPCIFESALGGGADPVNIGGNPVTIMAGLNCGEPNPFTWPILRDQAKFFSKCNDEVTKVGMRTLAKPIGDDEKVVSGESGAVGLGLVVELLSEMKYENYKKALQLDENSIILCFSTEGDTDPETYNKIVGEKE